MRTYETSVFLMHPKLFRIYLCLEIETNRKMKSDVILEFVPERLRHIPVQNLVKCEMNQMFIFLLI